MQLIDIYQKNFNFLGDSFPDKVAKFLINVEKDGNEKRESFIKQCFDSTSRFEEPISRREILNCSIVKKQV